MKQFRKTILLFAALLFLLIPKSISQAKTSYPASYIPGNVSWLTAKATSETSVKLTWAKAKGATRYRIYQVDIKTGKKTRVDGTYNTTYTITNLKPNQTLCYQVYAFKKVGSLSYPSKAGSPKATVTLKIATPSSVTGFRSASLGNCSVTLKWNASKNATGYVIYLYKSSTKKYKKIATTENLYRVVSGMTAGKEYTFVVRPYRSVNGVVKYGKYSDKVTITAKKIDISSIHGRRFTATTKYATTATVVSTGKTVTVKKGATVYAAAKRSSGLITAELSSGVKVKINGSALSYGNLYVQKTAYTQTQKEAWVNSRNYSSETDYLIWISQYTLTVTVFKGSTGEWKQVRSMICCIGRYGKTPTGVWRICRRDTYYGKPRIFFTWNQSMWRGNSFHCRIDSNTQAAVSGGCIRLADADLYYIANTCPMHTTVVSY